MTREILPNAHVSTHPCVRAKLSQLRSHATNARETKTLIHEISLLVACEALASSLASNQSGVDLSPLGYEFKVDRVTPSRISIMPILRSGLAMVDALQSLLPEPVPVHHLGLFRDKTTMTAVEYYNNLPYHSTSGLDSSNGQGPSDLVILVDPVIATGATACAAIETLREWGVKKVVFISIICSRSGIQRAADQWPDGVVLWAGGLDEECDENGMIKPGVGDIGDRLFLTIGK